jgi:hypothetical protein
MAVSKDIILTSNGTGGAGLIDGSQSNPAIAFTSQMNIGLYKAGVNTLGFTAAGNPMTFDGVNLVIGQWSGGSGNSVFPGSAGAGNNNRAGVYLSLNSGQSTGTGAAGYISFSNSPAGGGGGSLNAFVEQMRLKGDGTLAFGASQDVGISRQAAGQISVGNGTAGDRTGTVWAAAFQSISGVLTLNDGNAPVTIGSGSVTFANQNIVLGSASGTNGSTWSLGRATELLTLSTSGTTTDTSANLLPANSIIESVVARVTTTITTATDWKLGDATIAGRFTAADSTMTVGETQVGLVHIDQVGTSGPRQTAAAKVRVTTTGTPGAGVIRITVYYRNLVAPTG